MRELASGIAAMMLVGIATPAQAVPADYKAKADSIVAAAYPATAPGAVVVVYEKGRPVYAAARGLANVETGRALTPDTPMLVGSITKQFTATVILQLVEEGKLSLDDKLSKFIPDYPAPGREATIRQLLNHTSGIKSYTGIAALVAGLPPARTTDQLIAAFRDSPADFPAGSQWQYNNSGYVLLGAIIERTTGTPWYDAVATRIARPLGLKSLRYAGLPNGRDGMATGYSVTHGKASPADVIDMSFPHAAGALVANVDDLARWAYALHHGRLLKPASYAAMTTPTTLTGGKVEPYGFGLMMGEIRGHRLIGHDGGIPGFSSDSIYLPKDDVFVAVITNVERPEIRPGSIARRLATLAVGDPFPTFNAVALDEKAVTPLLGRYKFDSAERRMFLRGGKLYAQRDDNAALEVVPAGGNRFFYRDSLTWFEMVPGADRKPTMKFYSEGAAGATIGNYAGPVPAVAPAPTLARADLDRLAGTYDGPMPILVAVNGQGALTLKFGPQPVTHLVAETETRFSVEEVDAKVEFTIEGGRAKSLVILQNGQRLEAKRAS